MAPRTYSLNFMGDTMLGRLIDQMFPTHVHEPEEARIVQSLRRSSNHHLTDYTPTTPWGNTLPLLHSGDVNLLNLETSATTHDRKWPNKVFNYRMHPANVSALQAAKINYAGLANNHTLDFCEPGLLETVKTVKEAGIAFAGAGESKEEATKPAILKLKSATQDKDHEIHVWAASDHPQDWSNTPTFHFIDYTSQTRQRLKDLLTKPPRPGDHRPSLKIFSVHWGPNYSWQPAKEIQDLAHWLIDECGIDIIHGHSSHHVQGVEKYKGKLIIYGCGDFVDDYALTPGYRNDLSAVWRVTVSDEDDDNQKAAAATVGTADDQKQGRSKLKLKQLEVYPTIIERFSARRLEAGEADAEWVRRRIKELSKEFGTEVEVEKGGGGRVIVDLS